VEITIDAAAMSPMLGRKDVFDALLDALHERRGANEGVHVLKLRLRRAFQGNDLTVRVTNGEARVPAELAFIERTVAEVHPRASLRLLVARGAGPDVRASALTPRQGWITDPGKVRWGRWGPKG
jgi:hypothetical protein